MARIIEARVRQKATTLEKWNNSDLESLDGEQLFVRSDVDDKVIGFKLGANGKKFSELDYPDFTVRGKVSPTSTWVGRQSGVYIPTSNGVYNGIEVNLADGYQVLYWDGETLEKVVYPVDYSGAVFGGAIDDSKDLSTPPTEPTWYIASPGNYNTTPPITLTENSILSWDGNEWSHIPFELEVRGEFLVADNIAEVRNITPEVAQLLVNGTYKGVEVLGYYEKGDTPAPIIYYLSDTTEEDDGGSVIEAGGIKLEHEFSEVINVAYFGVGLQESQDSTDILNLIFSKFAGKTIEFVKNHDILIDPIRKGVRGVDVLSNTKILGNGAVLKAIPNSSTNYAVLSIWEQENVTIHNLNIFGERYEHTGTTGQWGMGFDVRGSSNINIYDCSGNECWGDGLYLGVVNDFYCKNVNIYNFKANNNRRQGISIVSVDGLNIDSATIENTSGQAPSAGIDIEPNDTLAVLRGININNLITRNNVIGINTTFTLMQGSLNEVDININNHFSENDTVSFSAYAWNSDKLTGNVNYNKPTSIKAKTRAIEIRNYSVNAPYIKITQPSIYNCNTNASSSAKYGAAIAIYRESGDPVNTDMGNIIIDSPIIIDDREVKLITTPIFIRDEADTTRSVKVDLINPRKIEGYTANSPVALDIDGIFDDKFNTAVLGLTTSNRTHDKFNFYKKYHNENATANRTVTLNVKEGSPSVEFEIRSGFELRINIQPTEYIEGWGGLGVPIMSKTIGSKISLRKKNENTWEVLYYSGTWVVLESSPVTGGGNVKSTGLHLSPLDANITQGNSTQGSINNTQNTSGSVGYPFNSGTSWFFDSGAPGKNFSLFIPRNDLSSNLYFRLYAIDGTPSAFYKVITSSDSATITTMGVVKQCAASADTATTPSATYNQAEVQAILTELRDLKTKLRAAGILAT